MVYALIQEQLVPYFTSPTQALVRSTNLVEMGGVLTAGPRRPPLLAAELQVTKEGTFVYSIAPEAVVSKFTAIFDNGVRKLQVRVSGKMALRGGLGNYHPHTQSSPSGSSLGSKLHSPSPFVSTYHPPGPAPARGCHHGGALLGSRPHTQRCTPHGGACPGRLGRQTN